MSQTAPTSTGALYLRIFLRTAIPFGLAMSAIHVAMAALFAGRWASVPDALRVGALSGLFFGLVMSAVLGSIALNATRREGLGALTVVQKRTIEVAGRREEVVQKVLAAIARIPKSRSSPVRDADGGVEAQVGISWKSWGEVVTARVTESRPGVQVVHVTSRPRFRPTVVDYGKSHANVEAVVRALQAQRVEDGSRGPSYSGPSGRA